MALALLVLFLPTARRDAFARGIRGTVLRPVLALQQGAVERNILFDNPAQLRAERDSLAAFLVGQSTVVAENRQLRELLGLHQRLPPSFVPAEVVRIPDRGSEGYFQLTAGTAQGVVAGASIVAAQGLVGRVREVDSGVAYGIDWTHSEFRASAMTVDGEIYGILEPRRIGGEDLLVLTGTPRHVELPENTQIVSSGHGGVFPRGIPIGVVIGPEGGEEGWQRNYVVRPYVSPSEMSYVLVLGDSQRTLEGQDLALVWGIRPVQVLPDSVRPDFSDLPPVPGGGQPAAQPAPQAPTPLGVPAGGGAAPTPPSAPAQQPAQQQPAPQQPADQPEPEPQGAPLLGDPVN